MTRKRRRLYLVLFGMALLGVATALMLNAFSDNLVFFHTPSDVTAKSFEQDRRFRLGGLVEEESVKKAEDGMTTHFRITDHDNAIKVVFKGSLPDLFREGQGVVAEGKLDASGVFLASEVLAKHDENYMPPEVADALKKSGQWKGDE
ncbi:MAG: cytochrome c maturation protein CcmE [Alphaproteobacteria bacterium]|jgi:cytochrome c-type biogenesis protein CcmE|nr:cytochrome c maturation protein CcmE [Alphaproteobacteria bacterium]MBT4017678.1 cytochrome c maturation protein CcmE [Alphaproteobacteria bacterium]MBT4964810.1 cytochrome c maturation protein CcmE [Alphaproteobacteria bacterium]MBT5162136.1 cytochrome c maturation protein CcmE [Alphaproteobacteria bacterium]MBT5919420.1 cytochrome c maturation protein CcmE [Alphaproteobacteria bacterium]